MTEEDAYAAFYALGSKYPAFGMAAIPPRSLIADLMSKKGEKYIAKHLPGWVPPSQRKPK